MGYKQIRTSDLSGDILDDSAVVTVVVRSHPDLQEGKIFDASAEELAPLKTVDNLVALELRLPDGTTKEQVCTKTEFSKLISTEQLNEFDSVRGRRTGYRPNGS